MNEAKPSVQKAADSDEFFIDELCFIHELSNSPDDEAVSIARARVEVGMTTRWHYLEGIIERYCILSGRGEAEIGDQPPAGVVAGDVVIIPPGCRQRIRNIGEDDLVFLAICSPRFQLKAYHDA